MKKLILLMLFISSFSFAQNGLFNQIKVTGATKKNDATRIVVQDSITKQYHWVLKNSLTSPTPTFQQVLNTGNVSLQASTVTDHFTFISGPDEAFFKTGGIGFSTPLGGGINASYNLNGTDVVHGDGTKFGLHPDNFTLNTSGNGDAVLKSDNLTGNRSFQYPDIPGTILTTGGTTTGFPIVGDFEVSQNFDIYSEGTSVTQRINLVDDSGIIISTSDNVTPTNISKLEIQKDLAGLRTVPSFDPDSESWVETYGTGVDIFSVNNVTNIQAGISIGNGNVDIFSKIGTGISPDSGGARGLTSILDYTPNITDLDYPQETYVIPRGGTKVGKPINGDLEISIPDDETNRKIFSSTPFVDIDQTYTPNSYNVNVIDKVSLFANSLGVYPSALQVDCSDPTSKGITSVIDYTGNITDLSYVQKKYADKGKLIAKMTASGNLDQTVINSETNVNFDNTDLTYGSITRFSNDFTVTADGLYTFNFQPQITETTATNTITLYAKKNGTNVPNTAIKYTSTGVSDTHVIMLQVTLDLVSSDTISFYAISSTAGGAVLDFTTAGGGAPNTPSVIVDISGYHK